MLKYKLIFLICLLLIIHSCSYNSYTEGNYIFPTNLEKIKIGISEKDVKKILGPETLKANFGENIVYYIYETSQKKLKFLDKEIIDYMLLIIEYKNNIVVNIEIKTLEDRKNITYDKSSYASTLKKRKLVDVDLDKIDSLN